MRYVAKYYKFECPKGHKTQKLLWSNDMRDKMPCGFNGCRKSSFIQVEYQTRNAQAEATVVFERMKDGKLERMFPGRTDHKTPEGWQRREVTGIITIRKFEKELNRDEKRKYQESADRERELFSRQQSYRHDQLRQDERQMDSFHRELSELARRAENEGYSKDYDPGMHIQAYS